MQPLQPTKRYLFNLKPESGFTAPFYATVDGIADEYTSMILLTNIKGLDKRPMQDRNGNPIEMFSCPDYWINSATPALSTDAGKKRSLKARKSKRRIRKSKRFRRR